MDENLKNAINNLQFRLTNGSTRKLLIAHNRNQIKILKQYYNDDKDIIICCIDDLKNGNYLIGKHFSKYWFITEEDYDEIENKVYEANKIDNPSLDPLEFPDKANRIKSYHLYNPQNAVAILAEGNPGALTFLMEIGVEKSKCFDVHQELYDVFSTIDEMHLYGPHLYMLWNDCCDRDTNKALKVIDYFKKGIIKPEHIKSRIKDVGYGLSFDDLLGVK